MSGMEGWRSSLNFSDRMSSVLTITASYQSAFPKTSLLEAQREGRTIEVDILAQASSYEDYNTLIHKKIAGLNALSSFQTPEKHIETPLAEQIPPGQQIGPYSNATYHQRGLFSTIYKAQTPDSTLLALKVTTPSQALPPHDPYREGRILNHVVHPSIIPLLSASTLPGGLYLLVFPFVPFDLDTLLRTHLREGHALSHACSILHDLFSALAHLHSLGIIHRDVKPSNILLASPAGPAYLADFGIAWMPGDRASEPAEQKVTDVGTTSYRPPELLFGHAAYGCSLDLWAAGCVVAELFLEYGKTLFDSGALGSELALIQSIFKTLGTPTLKIWPEAAQFSAWGKIEFYIFPPKPWVEVLPNASKNARDLVSQLVRYESRTRLDASNALKHPFFQDFHS